ncbi:MAG: high-affinity iron transporter [Cytophagales bacterium]|nr:high-affinity iron transporter [Cytophagales bacterium]
MQEFIITFRETFEAALIVGIILSYLRRTNQTKYYSAVFLGIAAAVAASIATALLFTTIAGGFTGRAEAIFEGVAMLITVVFLTFMILWCIKHKHKVSAIENKISANIVKGYKWGIFTLIFIAVLREGMETVVFLRGIIVAYEVKVLWFSILGVLAAILLGYAMFQRMVKLNLKVFFNVTSTLLIFFAAGLAAHGIHELQEAGLVTTFVEHVWDINPVSITHPLHEKATLGSFLVSLFGYNGNPSMIEALSYFAYLITAFMWWKRIEQGKKI